MQSSLLRKDLSRISMSQDNTRNWGIDLLRMVSMYMVCVLHTLSAGGILSQTANKPMKYCVAFYLNVCACCAVNVFALISGYVGVKAKIKYRNLLHLWYQVMFYSVGLMLLMKIVRPEAVTRMDILYSFCPTVTNRYWYFTSYSLMFFSDSPDELSIGDCGPNSCQVQHLAPLYSIFAFPLFPCFV